MSVHPIAMVNEHIKRFCFKEYPGSKMMLTLVAIRLLDLKNRFSLGEHLCCDERETNNRMLNLFC
jgi:hypothetical protein